MAAVLMPLPYYLAAASVSRNSSFPWAFLKKPRKMTISTTFIKTENLICKTESLIDKARGRRI
jgi:hypothetical protein